MAVAACAWTPPACAQEQSVAGTLWAGLQTPQFNRAASLEGFTLKRDSAELSLGGTLALGEVDGRLTAAVFKGAGRLRLNPALAMERQQMRLHSGSEALDAEFEQAVFIFSQTTADELADLPSTSQGVASGFASLFRKRTGVMRRWGFHWEPRLLKSLLAEDSTPHTFFAAEVKTRRHGWLTLVFDQSDPEQLELTRWDSGRRIRDIWAKFPQGGLHPREAFADPLAGREYRIDSYRISAAVEKKERLSVEAEATFEMRWPGERVLLVSLDPNLRVESVRLGEKSLRFFQPDDPKDKIFFGDIVALVSDEPFPVGQFTLSFRYSGKNVVRKVGDGNFFCQSFGWYPSPTLGTNSLNSGVFADRAHFDITLRIPKKYQAVAVGERLEVKKDKKHEVSRWKSEIPLAVAGFAFGDYKTHVEMVGDTKIEVYANKRPDDSFRALEIMSDMRAGDQLILGSLAPSRLAKTMAIEVANTFLLMEQFFGPYPYRKLAVSNIPFAYGQGWPSLLYISQLSFLDGTQRHQLGITDHAGITDYFRAHETSHQWWGHIVGWKSYHDQWLSEGFAQFSGNLYLWFRKKPTEYLKRLDRDRELILQKSRGGKRFEDLGPIYAGLRLRSSKHPRGYFSVVYEKGGWVLHMLRMMMFDASADKPDDPFAIMMRDFTKTYFNRPASTDDFKRTVEKHMNPVMNVDGNGTMDWFFDSWVYGSGVPKYELDFQVEPAQEEGRWVVSGALLQSEVPDGFKMVVPLFLKRGKGLIRYGWITARQERNPFKLEVPFKPDKVTINEWKEVLTRN